MDVSQYLGKTALFLSARDEEGERTADPLTATPGLCIWH